MHGILHSRWFVCVVVAAVLVVSTVSGDGGAPGSAADAPTFYSSWRTFTSEDGLPDSSIRAIRVDGDDVWVGTDGGLALLSDGMWRSWTATDGLPEAPVTAIAIDALTGDLWLGTWGGGIVRFTGGRFDRFTQYNSGLAGDLVLDIVAGEGVVWAATNGGISSFEPTAETWGLYLEARVDAPPDAATTLFRSADGLFAAAWCGPLLRFDPAGDEWIRLMESAPGATPGLRAVHAFGGAAVASSEAGAALWWTARGRLARRANGDGWRHLDAGAAPVGGAFVNCLAARSDSEAWLGTSAGLKALTDWETRTWVTYRRGAGGGQTRVALIRSGETVATRTVATPLPDDRIRCLAFEGDDVWVGTPSGLANGSGRTGWSGSGAGDSNSRLQGAEGAGREAGAPGTIPDARPWRGKARIGMLASSSTPIPKPGAASPWPAHPVDRVAVGRAVDQANARVGQSEKTFVLAENLDSFEGFGWGTVEDSFAALRDRENVSGIVAYIGPDARMDSALALHTEVPVVNFAPTEPAIHESDNPWVFRCGANDPRWPRRLMDHVLGPLARSRPAVLATPGPQSRAQLGRFIVQIENRGLGPVSEVEYDPEAGDPEQLIEQLRRSQPDVLLTWADARTTATLVRQLRAAGLNQLVVGSPLIVNREFVSLAGSDAGSVLALSRCPHFEVTGDAPPLDQETLRRRPAIARVSPTPQTDDSFDATAHLMVAIELAGPDREEVRETLRAMSEPVAATLEHGEWSFAPLGTAVAHPGPSAPRREVDAGR